MRVSTLHRMPAENELDDIGTLLMHGLDIHRGSTGSDCIS